jgi:hypothetical protein
MSEKNIHNPEKLKPKEVAPPRSDPQRTAKEIGRVAIGVKK